jgi:hypothetical protein
MGFRPALGLFPPFFDFVTGFDFVFDCVSSLIVTFSGSLIVTAAIAFFARSALGSSPAGQGWVNQCRVPQRIE